MNDLLNISELVLRGNAVPTIARITPRHHKSIAPDCSKCM